MIFPPELPGSPKPSFFPTPLLQSVFPEAIKLSLPQGSHIWHCSASSMPGDFRIWCLGRKFRLSGGDLVSSSSGLKVDHLCGPLTSGGTMRKKDRHARLW